MINLKQGSIFAIGILSIWFGYSTSACGSTLLRNERVSVLVSEDQPWNGKNGTGNLSYYGCDRDSNCIYLTGGKITCRSGICHQHWKHKNYGYTLSSPITSYEKVGDELSITLTILELDGGQILSTEKLYPRPLDN